MGVNFNPVNPNVFTPQISEQKTVAGNKKAENSTPSASVLKSFMVPIPIEKMVAKGAKFIRLSNRSFSKFFMAKKFIQESANKIIATALAITFPGLVCLAALTCLSKVLASKLGGASQKTENQNVNGNFAQKFPTAQGLNEPQMQTILKADDLLNRIAQDTKGLSKINNQMNAAMRGLIPSSQEQTYISAEVVKNHTNPATWKETESRLNEIKQELKKDPSIGDDPIMLSNQTSVKYSSKYGHEAGMVYSKAINQCSEELKQSPDGEKLNEDHNKAAIHETYVRLQTMETALSGPRKMSVTLKDKKSYDQLDKMYQEVRNARVELMKEFGVEVTLGQSFDWL